MSNSCRRLFPSFHQVPGDNNPTAGSVRESLITPKAGGEFTLSQSGEGSSSPRVPLADPSPDGDYLYSQADQHGLMVRGIQLPSATATADTGITDITPRCVANGTQSQSPSFWKDDVEQAVGPTTLYQAPPSPTNVWLAETRMSGGTGVRRRTSPRASIQLDESHQLPGGGGWAPASPPREDMPFDHELGYCENFQYQDQHEGGQGKDEGEGGRYPAEGTPQPHHHDMSHDMSHGNVDVNIEHEQEESPRVEMMGKLTVCANAWEEQGQGHGRGDVDGGDRSRRASPRVTFAAGTDRPSADIGTGEERRAKVERGTRRSGGVANAASPKAGREGLHTKIVAGDSAVQSASSDAAGAVPVGLRCSSPIYDRARSVLAKIEGTLEGEGEVLSPNQPKSGEISGEDRHSLSRGLCLLSARYASSGAASSGRRLRHDGQMCADVDVPRFFSQLGVKAPLLLGCRRACPNLASVFEPLGLECCNNDAYIFCISPGNDQMK